MSTRHVFRLARVSILCAAFAGGLVAVPALAQTFTVIHNFTGGSQPSFPATLVSVLGRDGNIYSESYNGGSSNNGTIFNATPSGSVNVVHNKEAGCGPHWLSAGSDGNIYGACGPTSASPNGYIWKMTLTGTFTDLHDFNGSGDGNYPIAPLLAADGNLYGVTYYGGGKNAGTFYKFSPKTSTLSTLYTFTGGSDGGNPLCIPVQGANGSFYCTTEVGGGKGLGTIFSVSSSGKFSLVHTFAGGSTDGADGDSGLILATDGNFYGVTRVGGSSNQGTVIKMTPSGTVTVLHSLNGTTDGGYPANGVIQASDGNFYGAANDCTSGGCGTNWTAFKVTPSGTFTVLHTFNGGSDGRLPDGGIVQLTSGTFYGVCEQGGSSGNGTLWTISTGLKPFIILGSTSGRVGSTVGILGQGFDSTSVVKFNGTTATKVTRTGSTYLVATVPAGATDGFVTVTTGTTTLKSTQKYIVHNSWASGAAMPVAVEGAAAGFVNGKIYVVGGAAGGAPVANNQVYNPTTNTWTTGAALPTPVSAAASVVVNGILYVIGGYESGGAPSNAVQAYNPKTNAWSTKSAMPTARGSAAAVVDGTAIYVIGGNGSTLRLNTVEKYVPATDSWTEEAPLLVGKSEPSAGLLGTKIVVPDGYTTSGDTGDNEAYNVSTNSWSGLTADPTARNASCFGTISGLLYVAGGGANGSPQSLTESFSIATDKWTTLAAMPQSTIVPASAVANGLLYCFGGSNVDHGAGTFYKNVQIYQP